jgi:hypothetical protein
MEKLIFRSFEIEFTSFRLKKKFIKILRENNFYYFVEKLITGNRNLLIVFIFYFIK